MIPQKEKVSSKKFLFFQEFYFFSRALLRSHSRMKVGQEQYMRIDKGNRKEELYESKREGACKTSHQQVKMGGVVRKIGLACTTGWVCVGMFIYGLYGCGGANDKGAKGQGQGQGQGQGHEEAVVSSDEQWLKEGERLYYLRDCVRCHGFKGDGAGLAVRSKKSKARDFADMEAYRGGTSAEAIAKTLAVGIRTEEVWMPGYGYLSEEERLSLGKYVVFLRQKRMTWMDAKKIKKLKKSNESKKKRTPLSEP